MVNAVTIADQIGGRYVGVQCLACTTDLTGFTVFRWDRHRDIYPVSRGAIFAGRAICARQPGVVSNCHASFL
ncbi:hypothetical protein [Asticcacaulis sp. AC402]|uniref:hypothetical protein n=1 Tax=Asticcacaulis sp. AC402 TaxID=1282361 RepID=UPI0003C40034|nr:hypothetical protein [Asticcacaulis sp. AC402]ESQ76633.1 hypothetical protein ABAC402_02865 [Asticcacaulis sp. AC402]